MIDEALQCPICYPDIDDSWVVKDDRLECGNCGMAVLMYDVFYEGVAATNEKLKLLVRSGPTRRVVY